jgi:hypothetical protein
MQRSCIGCPQLTAANMSRSDILDSRLFRFSLVSVLVDCRYSVGESLRHCVTGVGRVLFAKGLSRV